MATTHNIYVSMIDEGPHLRFKEGSVEADGINFETEVQPGDTIIWHNNSPDKIYSFVGIQMYDDPTGTNMLSINSANQTTMVGTISADIPIKHGELHENYFVQYKTWANGPVVLEDPKLKMRKQA